mmetsp:Transcript_2754/g.6575  ORF Transcript_2754/g.6575 Transcript_2754/m.6575 type:complete len:308 (+) Transcript_2754:64-987(+)
MNDISHKNTEKTQKRKKGSKMGRPKIGMFFNNGTGRKESSSEDIVQRLLQENRQLRQELIDANNRIRELERAAPIPKESMEHYFPLSEPKPSDAESASARGAMDNRDDDSYALSDATQYDTDDFSVEVEASEVEFLMRELQQREDEEELLDFDEEQSATPSACTIPTGNDKKSNTRRRQSQLRRRVRGSDRNRNEVPKNHDARHCYFPQQQRHSSIETITEMAQNQSLLDLYGIEDLISITSDLSSVSSSVEDNVSTGTSNSKGNSLMSGKMLPLYAMKSLLRISSTDSDFTSLGLEDEESILLGEI